MKHTTAAYIPALRYSWLTGFYDPVVALTTREATFKSALLHQAKLRAGQRVLDLACGTGTLAIAAKRAQPEADIIGLDGDTVILERARRKAQRAGVPLQLELGLSTALPFADASFDCVLSSLFFHHLTREHKRKSFAEVLRVLKPGGELHVADWGKAQNPLMRMAFLGIQLLDGFPTTSDNVRGLLPQLMHESGLRRVEETRRYATLFGTMSLYRALKPG
jgi:ubiquinone/menaquinone biosynthesis C-methylase UbiE